MVWWHTCPISFGWWSFLGLCGVVRDMKIKKPSDFSIGSTLMSCLLIIGSTLMGFLIVCFLLVIGMGLIIKNGIVSTEMVMRKLFRQWRPGPLTLPSPQVILRFLHGTQHRSNAFASVWANSDTWPARQLDGSVYPLVGEDDAASVIEISVSLVMRALRSASTCWGNSCFVILWLQYCVLKSIG